MIEQKKFPNYYISLIKKDKKSVQIVFWRNNLSIEMFRLINNSYVFEEKLKHNTCKIDIELCIENNIFESLFTYKTKNFFAKGNPHNFGIKFTSKPINIQAIVYNQASINIKGENDNVFFRCKLNDYFYKYKMRNKDGNLINKPYYPKADKKNNKKNNFDKSIYSVSAWSVSHPYSGGRVSPR